VSLQTANNSNAPSASQKIKNNPKSFEKDSVETTRWVVSKENANYDKIIGNKKHHQKTIRKQETTHRVVSTGLKPNSLGSMMGQFKSICTKRIRGIGHDNFSWQSRFHEHIIRNEKSLNRIRDYIIHNPIKWKFDKYFRQENNA
jgi:hypothetical protein